MAEPAQPLNINTLHNVHAVEELTQLTIEANAEVRSDIKKKIWKYFFGRFLKNLWFWFDFKVYLPPFMYKINTHNKSIVRS